MPPIRVLQVMPAMDAGGMETFVMNVYRTIDREKVQFDFLYHYDKPCFFDDEIRALGGRIFKLTVRQDNNLPRYLRELRALFAAHPEWRIIHGHYSGFGMFYNPAARRAGIPVRCGHSHNTAYERNFVGQLDHFMSSFFNIGLTDRFACSEKAGQMLFGKHPFTVVPNGIDTARFAARDPQRRALLRGELGVTDQEILFGHVGRFSDQKNHPGLLKIFAAVRTRLPKARLVLLGGGDPAYVEKMQALAAELGLGDSVIFAGVRSNIQSFYDAMDAFLLPRLVIRFRNSMRISAAQPFRGSARRAGGGADRGSALLCGRHGGPRRGVQRQGKIPAAERHRCVGKHNCGGLLPPRPTGAGEGH